MKKILKGIVEFIFNLQEKHYAHKYKNQAPVLKYSATSSTTKSHLRAGVSLTLDSKTKQNKALLDKNVKELVQKNIKCPELLLDYVKEKGTKVYKVPYADKLLAFVGEEEGFITPVYGINGLVLNIFLEKKVSLKTDAMFVLRDLPLNIYVLAHQFHKWYAYKMQMPGFDENAQKNFKKIWEFELEENVKGLSYEDAMALKEAIQRDIEAIDFVVNLSKENEGAKKVFKNILDKKKDTNL